MGARIIELLIPISIQLFRAAELMRRTHANERLTLYQRSANIFSLICRLFVTLWMQDIFYRFILWRVRGSFSLAHEISLNRIWVFIAHIWLRATRHSKYTPHDFWGATVTSSGFQLLLTSRLILSPNIKSPTWSENMVVAESYILRASFKS